MAKKVTTIRISPWILQELKIEAVRRNVSLGDVIECHYLMSKMDSYYGNEKFQKIFRGFKEDIFSKAGTFDEGHEMSVDTIQRYRQEDAIRSIGVEVEEEERNELLDSIAKKNGPK